MDQNPDASSLPTPTVLDNTQQAFLQLVTREILREIAPQEEAFVTPFRVRRLTRLALEQKVEVAGEAAEYGMGAGRLLSRIIVPILVEVLVEFNRQREGAQAQAAAALPFVRPITIPELRSLAAATGTPLAADKYSSMAALFNRVLDARAAEALPGWRAEHTPQTLRQRELQQLHSRLAALGENHALLQAKLVELERAAIIEAGAAVKFQLAQQIGDAQREIERLDQERQSLKRAIRDGTSGAGEEAERG